MRPLTVFLAGFTGVDDRLDVVGHVWPRVALPSVEKSLGDAGVAGMKGADYLRPQRLRNDDACAAKDEDACRRRWTVRPGRTRKDAPDAAEAGWTVGSGPSGRL
jgi:hypothetical protein